MFAGVEIMKYKNQYRVIFALFILLFIMEVNISIRESKAASYNPNIFQYQGYNVMIDPNDFTIINFNLIGSKIEILSDVHVNLTIGFNNFVFSRHVSLVVNNSDPIDLIIEWYLNLDGVSELLLEEMPKQPTLGDIFLIFKYNCFFQIISNITIDTLTLRFDKLSEFGLDPSKQFFLASFMPGDPEWRIFPTEEKADQLTSKTYLETVLTDVNGTNSHYFTIYERAPGEPHSPLIWIISISVPTGIILVALVTIISKKDYIEYIRNRTDAGGSNQHNLSLDEVLENENRSLILDLILKQPGIHFNELLRETKISPGNLAWHLDVLLSYKIIGKRRFENYLIYYPYYLENPLSNIDLKLQKSKLTLKMLKIIEKKPGICNSEISKILHVNRKTLQYHIEKLIELELISKKRIGRKNQLFLNTDKSF